MGFIQTSESFNGSDCTGIDGAKNRVLTLTNTGLTKQGGFQVFVSGLAIAETTGYTVTHVASGTTITFVSRLWDDLAILVYYAYTDSSVFATIRTDVQSIINDNGQTGTLIRQSEATDSMGGVTDVSETEYTIILMIQDITKKDRKIHEMGLAVPGNVKAFVYHEYPNSITGNGTVSVQTGDIYKESSGKKWRIETITGERYMDSSEIFKVIVLKNIYLEE